MGLLFALIMARTNARVIRDAIPESISSPIIPKTQQLFICVLCVGRVVIDFFHESFVVRHASISHNNVKGSTCAAPFPDKHRLRRRLYQTEGILYFFGGFVKRSRYLEGLCVPASSSGFSFCPIKTIGENNDGSRFRDVSVSRA